MGLTDTAIKRSRPAEKPYKLADGKGLFPGDREPSRPMSNNTILLALDRMGYRGRQTGHGFRGLASTILHEQGYPHEHIELQLAHAPRNAVSAAYKRRVQSEVGHLLRLRHHQFQVYRTCL